MKSVCSLHCGHFSGVNAERFQAEKGFLEGLFRFVSFESETGALDVTGAQGLAHDPDMLIDLFNRFAGLLGEQGRGRIILQCDGHEICYFRKSMWKLLAISIPEDPFDDIHYV